MPAVAGLQRQRDTWVSAAVRPEKRRQNGVGGGDRRADSHIAPHTLSQVSDQARQRVSLAHQGFQARPQRLKIISIISHSVPRIYRQFIECSWQGGVWLLVLEEAGLIVRVVMAVGRKSALFSWLTVQAVNHASEADAKKFARR